MKCPRSARDFKALHDISARSAGKMGSGEIGNPGFPRICLQAVRYTPNSTIQKLGINSTSCSFSLFTISDPCLVTRRNNKKGNMANPSGELQYEIPKECVAGVVVNEGPDFRIEVQNVLVPEIGMHQFHVEI
jgi:hypothetical protein